MNFVVVMLLTYDIVSCVPSHTIQQEHHFGPATIIDLAKLCREVMLPTTCRIYDITYYIETNGVRSIYVTLRSFRLV